jgi:hypothetical protein
LAQISLGGAAEPLQDERKLEEQLVESKLEALECEGMTG